MTKTAGGEVKAAFETLGYYAAAGVESADAQIQTMGRENSGRTAGFMSTLPTPPAPSGRVSSRMNTKTRRRTRW